VQVGLLELQVFKVVGAAPGAVWAFAV